MRRKFNIDNEALSFHFMSKRKESLHFSFIPLNVLKRNLLCTSCDIELSVTANQEE